MHVNRVFKFKNATVHLATKFNAPNQRTGGKTATEIIISYIIISSGAPIRTPEAPYNARQLSYRKEDRALRAIYGCTEKF